MGFNPLELKAFGFEPSVLGSASSGGFPERAPRRHGRRAMRLIFSVDYERETLKCLLRTGDENGFATRDYRRY